MYNEGGCQVTHQLIHLGEFLRLVFVESYTRLEASCDDVATCGGLGIDQYQQVSVEAITQFKQTGTVTRTYQNSLVQRILLA
jgi:hypothetical protein